MYFSLLIVLGSAYLRSMQASDVQTIIIICAKFTSHLLAEEVKALHLPVRSVNLLDVTTEGTVADAMRLNMHLRTAHRVLFLLKSFKARDGIQVYKHIRNMPWEDYLTVQSYFSISSFVRNETIRDHRFANLKVKDAIVDRMQSLYDKRPDSGPAQDQAVFFLHWREEEASIYMDTSGESIARHGYRRVTVAAPMQESLAAAVIRSTRWHPSQPFVNPMCGSGTLAIEAALIKAGKAPGLIRENYGFMHLKNYSPVLWEQIKAETARQAQDTEAQYSSHTKTIIATDHDPKAVQAARENAAAAGVAHLIRFEVCNFEETPLPELLPDQEASVVVLNPPYGERLGEVSALEPVYQGIGDFFKQRCAGYWGYIFTGNLDLSKKVRLRTKRRVEFLNARIDSRLLEYELYVSH